MTFKINASLSSVRMSNGGWKITFDVPQSDSLEMAKICAACQDELLAVLIENESHEPIGQKSE